MLNISDAEKSIKENRMLAEKPDISHLFDDNKNYGQEFETWFNDRFYFRKKVIRLYEFIGDLLITYQNERVLLGQDGWCFYKGDNGVNNYKNIELYTDNELLKIRQYLTDINNWCKKNGKKFIYIIAPDKNKIYGQYYPDTIIKFRPDNQSKTQQLMRYLSDSNIKVVYPVDVIKKSEDLTYYKNDTHWNAMGALIAYNELTKVSSAFHKIKIKGFDFIKCATGDLTNMWDKIKPDTMTQYKIPKYENFAQCDHDIYKPEDTRCLNNTKAKEAFVLRDSFMTALSNYINQSFKKVSYHWRYNLTSEDLNYIKNNVDVVILENVERYTYQLSNLTFPERVN